jgi:hypothetical protein
MLLELPVPLPTRGANAAVGVWSGTAVGSGVDVEAFQHGENRLEVILKGNQILGIRGSAIRGGGGVVRMKDTLQGRE